MKALPLAVVAETLKVNIILQILKRFLELTLKCEHPAHPTWNLVFETEGAVMLGIVPVTPAWYPFLSKPSPKLMGLSKLVPLVEVSRLTAVLIPETSL